MLLKQFLVGGIKNFVYVIADEKSKQAAVVDTTETEEVIDFLDENRMKLVYIFNTHSHHDHIGGNSNLKKLGGKIVAFESGDIPVEDGDVLQLGSVKIKIFYTPGHTEDSICILAEDCLFTGDTLFVEECGRTDFPSGDSRQMYNSLKKIAKLPGSIKIYPGHLYGGSSSTIAEEKKSNYCLAERSEEEFVKFMQE